MDNIKDVISQAGVQRKPRLQIVRQNQTPPKAITHDISKRERIPLVVGACTLCRGAGFLRANVPYGHPNFGKALACECKIAERKRQLQQELVATSGILSLEQFEHATFETFNRSRPGVMDGYMKARQFADQPKGWLVMVGPYGCGKTHLAVAIARVRIEAGDMVLIQTVPDLLDHLRSAFSPNAGQGYSELFEQMRNVDLLILDDYGAQNDTAWVTEKLFQLLNYRYNRRLATMITSNKLEGTDPRLYSRMHARDLVTLVNMQHAGDYRLEAGD